jgi:hypothetical protein
MTTFFKSDKYVDLLDANQMTDFDAVWGKQIEWFEEPNTCRGGWSGVGRMELVREDGSVIATFLKKQKNHKQKTLLHPFTGIPTFEREFDMLRYLTWRGLKTPEVMLFAQGKDGKFKTTLMTKELSNYISLEFLTSQMFADNHPTLGEQNILLEAIADYTKRLHDTKVQHRAFYPKHLFIKQVPNAAPKVAVIDLEKARINLIPAFRSLMDLAALHRHAAHWSKSRRMYFYLQYLGLKKLTPYAKWLCKQIIKRASRARRSA